jgi:hypothetical protein
VRGAEDVNLKGSAEKDDISQKLTHFRIRPY